MLYKKYEDKEKTYFIPEASSKMVDRILAIHNKRGFKTTPIIIEFMASTVIDKATGVVLKNLQGRYNANT